MAEEIAVGGITVPISHPDKVLFPDDGITKKDLARYYAVGTALAKRRTASPT